MTDVTQTTSFISVTRNDNYGGELIDRVYNYTRSITRAAESTTHNIEILFVEWNPPEDEESMSAALNWPDFPENVEVKFIEVPQRLHRQQDGAEEMPVFEYIGKNVGVRRAADGPVVVTNPDLIYSEDLVRCIPQLSTEGCFYRVDRHDIDSVPDRSLDLNELANFCEERTYAIQNRSDTAKPGPAADHRLKRYAEYLRDLGLKRYVALAPWAKEDRFDPPSLFTHVAGDFILTDKENWCEMRGFPETEFNWGIDRLMVLNMYNSSLQQKILHSPYKIYHQYHENMHAQRPQPDLGQVLDSKVGDEPRPVWQPNGDDWGLGSEELPEYRI